MDAVHVVSIACCQRSRLPILTYLTVAEGRGSSHVGGRERLRQPTGMVDVLSHAITVGERCADRWRGRQQNRTINNTCIDFPTRHHLPQATKHQGSDVERADP
jgi:hypothetical protein